ncbi:MAG: hypothetical protein PUA49_09400 [Butyrivibrio sp.]|nr:hypothetical protein [Butyrivibrio sp.]
MRKRKEDKGGGMMERLTKNVIGCYQIKGCGNLTCREICNNVLNCKYCPISEAINKLAEYEDFEEIFREKRTDAACEILKDKEEFSKWLDRIEWIAKKCDEYARAEEQGLLLRLPCHIGDTVWDNDYGKPCAYTITGFSFGTGEDYIDEPVSLNEVVCYYSNSSGSITGSFAVSEIGKTVFLTQYEAEQQLKEMESD